MTKRILCLANSRKLNGRCIAGREVKDGQPGAWVRPVSNREHQEVSEYERQYQDGSDPRVLDIIDVPLLDWRPGTFQQENWLLDPDFYWTQVGRAPWEKLATFVDPVAGLWVNGYSTYHGHNDQIPLAIAEGLTSSLVLIEVSEVHLTVFAPGQAFGNSKRRVQARFSHAGDSYRVWATDPDYEKQYLALPNGEHELGRCCLTVSLGEPYDGYCYKLVAAIIEKAATDHGGTQ